MRVLQNNRRKYAQSSSRTNRITALTAIAMLCLFPMSAQSDPHCITGAETETTLEEVAPGVFVRAGVHAIMSAENLGAIANTGFIVGSRGIAVIDTGGSACDGMQLRNAIKATSPLPILYVINTHMHPDHVFGNAAFEADNPTYVGHENLARALAARGSHYLTSNREIMGDAALEGTKIIPPGLTVEGRMEIDLGGRVLEIVAHPTGHTDNDLTVYDQRTRTLWTGDLVFLEHLPVIDGTLMGWIAVLKSLKTIPALRAIPGHGPASIPWPGGVADQERYLSVLVEDLRRMIAAGASMNDAISRAAGSERENWQLFDEFNPRNASVGFAELEWE